MIVVLEKNLLSEVFLFIILEMLVLRKEDCYIFLVVCACVILFGVNIILLIYLYYSIINVCMWKEGICECSG